MWHFAEIVLLFNVQLHNFYPYFHWGQFGKILFEKVSFRPLASPNKCTNVLTQTFAIFLFLECLQKICTTSILHTHNKQGVQNAIEHQSEAVINNSNRPGPLDDCSEPRIGGALQYDCFVQQQWTLEQNEWKQCRMCSVRKGLAYHPKIVRWSEGMVGCSRTNDAGLGDDSQRAWLMGPAWLDWWCPSLRSWRSGRACLSNCGSRTP
jgi:hypothetical protein